MLSICLLHAITFAVGLHSCSVDVPIVTAPCPTDTASVPHEHPSANFDGNATLAYLISHSKQYVINNVNGVALAHLVREVVVPRCDCFTLLTGGLNDGALLAVFTEGCPQIAAVGFEVRRHAAQNCLIRFAANPNVRVLHCGASSGSDVVTVNGDNALAGIGQSGMWSDPKRKNEEQNQVKTIPLASLAPSVGLLGRTGRVDLLTIDTEGHEASVIAGMQLDDEANRKRFGAFQFEIGGTWFDTRHPKGSWSIEETSLRLNNWGYSLYLFGHDYKGNDLVPGLFEDGNETTKRRFAHVKASFLWVTSDFMSRPHTGGWRHGGDALALHHEFANPALVAFVRQHTVAFRLTDHRHTHRDGKPL